MKKLLIATAIAATFVTPQAFAQAKNFEGFSLALNLNIADSKTELTAINTKFSASESAQNAGFQAQYAVALNDKFVLGFGASAGLGELKSGFVNNTTTTKTKDANAVYIAPGYAISDTMLVYGKLSSITAKGEISNVGGTITSDVSGTGYGIGLQSMINKNYFLQAEYNQNKYDLKVLSAGVLSQEKASSVLSVGVGYKF